MLRATTIAFTTTVSLLIPAAWHTTVADLPVDGSLVKPAIETITVDGVEVKVEADRAAVAPGEEVHLKLYALSDTPKKIALDVREQEQMGSPGERVEREPKTLSRRSVSIVAGPEATPTLLSFRMPASKGKRGMVKQFNFVVEPKQKHQSADGDDETVAAMVSVVTHDPEAYSIHIEPPAQISAGKPFDVAVRVKNPSKKPVQEMYIDLSPAPENIYASNEESIGGGASDDFKIERSDGKDDALVLAPGEEKVLHFQVTPGKELPRIAFMASAYSNELGTALAWEKVEPTAAVAAK
jgi:hypothetical protein